MHRYLAAVLLSIACGLGVGSPLAAQELPRWKFTAGEVLEYEVSQQTSIEVDAGEAGAFVIETRQVLDVAWQIAEVDDAGAATGVQRIERIRLDVTMPTGLELRYDSANDHGATGIAAMLIPMFDALIESELPIRLAADGEVLKCDLPEAMANRLERVPATRALSYLVVGTGVRQIAEHMALPLTGSDEPLPRDVVIENRILGTLKGELVWLPAESDEAGVAVFTPELSLTVEPAPLPTDDDSQPAPLESPAIVSQTVEGNAQFDVDAGRLKASTRTLDLALEGELMNNKVCSQMKQTVEVKAK